MKLGVYQHYKGEHYLIVGVAADANADALWVDDPHGSLLSHHELLRERKVVVYVPLYYDTERAPMWVRTLGDFEQLLCNARWEDGKCHAPMTWNGNCPNHGFMNARPIRRFEYVGEMW